MASSSSKSFMKSREKFVHAVRLYTPTETPGFVEEQVFKSYVNPKNVDDQFQQDVIKSAQRLAHEMNLPFKDVYELMARNINKQLEELNASIKAEVDDEGK